MRSKGAVPLVTCTPSGKLICSGRWCETLSLNIYIEWHILVTGALAHLETRQRLRMRENLNIPGTESCNQRTFCYGCRQNYRNKKNKGRVLDKGSTERNIWLRYLQKWVKNVCVFFLGKYLHTFSIYNISFPIILLDKGAVFPQSGFTLQIACFFLASSSVRLKHLRCCFMWSFFWCVLFQCFSHAPINTFGNKPKIIHRPFVKQINSYRKQHTAAENDRKR